MKPQGRLLQKEVTFTLPGDKTMVGDIWQHTDGAMCIYAVVPYKGEELYLAITPQWNLTIGENGQPIYQGMSPDPEEIK